MIKTRKILRKIVKTGAAEICLYLCSHIPDITRHKSINVSKRIKTLEVSETFDPLWSLLRGTQHLSESALMICRPQDILNFIVSILSIGLFSQSISDRSNLILHLAILWFSFFFHGVFMHHYPFKSIMQPIGGVVALRRGKENRERFWSAYIWTWLSHWLNLKYLHPSLPFWNCLVCTSRSYFAFHFRFIIIVSRYIIFYTLRE